MTNTKTTRRKSFTNSALTLYFVLRSRQRQDIVKIRPKPLPPLSALVVLFQGFAGSAPPSHSPSVPEHLPSRQHPQTANPLIRVPLSPCLTKDFPRLGSTGILICPSVLEVRPRIPKHCVVSLVELSTWQAKRQSLPSPAQFGGSWQTSSGIPPCQGPIDTPDSGSASVRYRKVFARIVVDTAKRVWSALWPRCRGVGAGGFSVPESWLRPGRSVRRLPPPGGAGHSTLWTGRPKQSKGNVGSAGPTTDVGANAVLCVWTV
jgi:hypothetical protein